eukprot:620105-Prorocentrum_minimum.AAC.2
MLAMRVPSPPLRSLRRLSSAWDMVQGLSAVSVGSSLSATFEKGAEGTLCAARMAARSARRSPMPPSTCKNSRNSRNFGRFGGDIGGA